MKSLFNVFRRPPVSGKYRIVRRLGGYEPQMSYTAGLVEGVFWFPLDLNGYWLEPEAFTNGKITKHISLPKEDAKRATIRAMAHNEANLTIATNPER